MKAGKAIKLPFKIIGIVIALILLLLIGVNVWLCVKGFPPKVKNFAVEQMQKQLHRQVKVGKVGLCLLKGIVIKDVEISNRPSFKQGPFLKCKAIVLKYDLMQLLKKKLIVEKATIEEPEIYVQRYIQNKKVVFNFSDLIPPLPKKQPAAPKEEKVVKKKAVKPVKVSKYAIPVDLQVGKVGLEKAKIEVTDTATAKFKEVYILSDVTFLIENIKLYENAPVKITSGFGLSVTEFKDGQKTDKDINLEADIKGVLTLFDKKGWLNPTGVFDLALLNGKFTGIQAYDELRNQAKDISGSVSKYQDSLVKSFEKMSAGADKLKQAGALGSKVKGATDKAGSFAEKVGNMDIGFIKGALEWKFLKKTLEFDKVSTKVKIENGKVISEDIDANGTDFNVVGGGYAAMDTTLSYNLSMLGAKKYNKNAATKAIANEAGQIELPVAVKGTTSDPKFIFNKDEILKKIQNGLKQEFMSKFMGKGGSLDDVAKQYLNQYMGKYLGDTSKYLSKDGAKEAVSDVKNKANEKVDAAKAEAQKKADEAKAVADAAKAKAEADAQAAVEAEKKKAEEAAKKKAEEEAKKKLKGKLGF
ncbi:MAG: AsmA-like C-terminal region-containing protein [Spirochaetes bacterium]|nr:AsmA-like C-terminal region-containing protein [Spirochaetota bacterium]